MQRLVVGSAALLLAFVIGQPNSHAAAARPVGGAAKLSQTEFRIDGTLCRGLVEWSGGGASADAIAEGGAGNAPAKRHLGTVRCEPIIAQFSFPLAPPLVAWMEQTSAGNNPRRTISIRESDASGRPLGAPLEGLNTLLAEIRFPALSSGSTTTQLLTVVFAPQSMLPAATGQSSAAASAAGTDGAAAFNGNFRLDIQGLNMSGTSAIGPLTIRQGAPPASGEVRDYATQSGPTEFSTLVVQIALDSAADLQAWHEAFVVKGSNSDESEKLGTLQLLGGNGATLLPLTFSNLGIMRLTRLPTASGGPRRVEAEFYFERLSFNADGSGKSMTSTGAAAGGAASAGSTITPAGGSTPAELATTAPAGPATMIDPAPGAPSRNASPTLSPADSAVARGAPGARELPAGTLDPAPARTLERAPRGAPNAAAPVATGADSVAFGSFPVAQGAERTSFTLILRPDTAQVTANYAAATPLLATVERYEQQIRAAAWEETFHNESGESARGTLSVTAGWSKGSGNAQLSFRQAEGNKTEFSVTVSHGAAPDGRPYLPLVPDVATPMAGGATTSNAADQGSRDPANFPRAPGSVRVSYGSSRSGGKMQENAVYTASGAPPAHEAYFANALMQDGWTEIFRHETGDTAGTGRVTTDWEKSGRTVRLILAATKDQTEIAITLATPLPARTPGA